MKEKSPAILALTSAKLGNHGAKVKDEPALIRSIFGKEKRAVIREFMQLDKKDEEAFWPLYETYEQQLKKLDRKREKVLTEIQTDLDIESAVAASREFIKWTGRYLGFFGRNYKKFRKALGIKKTGALFRLQLTLLVIHEKPPGIEQSASDSTVAPEER